MWSVLNQCSLEYQMFRTLQCKAFAAKSAVIICTFAREAETVKQPESGCISQENPVLAPASALVRKLLTPWLFTGVAIREVFPIRSASSELHAKVCLDLPWHQPALGFLCPSSPQPARS